MVVRMKKQKNAGNFMMEAPESSSEGRENAMTCFPGTMEYRTKVIHVMLLKQ